jgi:hypothetical protein
MGDVASDRMQIDYCASDDVRRVIAAIGRTEDIRFSPTNGRLAVAAAGRDKIAIFDIEIVGAGASPSVRLTDAVEIASPCLKYPHGLDFIDEATLMVGNRYGDVAVFALPPVGSAAHLCELEPLRILPAGPESSIRWPGSLAIVRRGPSACEFLVCNNYRHNITRHVLDREIGTTDGEVVLSKWLEVPDGISVSSDGRWIAVSNHWTHGVLVYENKPSPGHDRDPDGILRSMHHPHGVRFSADGRYLFVADAGAPYVHIYASDDDDWRGVRSPMASFKVMDDAAFLRGHVNVHEGGPKGIDLDKTATVLAVTSEHQPLAFFDLTPTLRAGRMADPSLDMQFELGAMEMATGCRRQLNETLGRIEAIEANAARAHERAIKAEATADRQAARAAKFKAKAEKAKAKAAKAKARGGFVINGRPWPITAPIRRLYSALKRPN